MARAGARQVIVAGAEHEVVEGEIAREHESLFLVVVLMRGKLRAGLRADQERDAALVAAGPASILQCGRAQR